MLNISQLSNIDLYKAYSGALKNKLDHDFLDLLLSEIKTRKMPLPLSIIYDHIECSKSDCSFY